MEGGRMRRSGRGGQSNQTILPFRGAPRLSNTISCWYCDFKFSLFNQPLFLFGRRYSRYLRSWFSMGVGFSLATLVGVTLVLLWELGSALHLFNREVQFIALLSSSLFGFSSGLSGLMISLADIGYLFISTIVSVSVHELGHALAAARWLLGFSILFLGRAYNNTDMVKSPALISSLLCSLLLSAVLYWRLYVLSNDDLDAAFLHRSEGIQMEYVAVFLAILFPGALVAFDHELLQTLPRSAALRIYCAGIWHNAGLCAVCAMSLFILPLILYPVYIYGEGPMVLDVSSASPLSRYLSPNDVIHSVDGIHVTTVQEWLQVGTSLTEQEYLSKYSASKNNTGKGYCFPYSLLEKRIRVQLRGNETTCPNGLIAFGATSCPESRLSDDWHLDEIYCMYADDILKLKKCGDGWAKTSDNSSRCLCSQEESCLAPVLLPGVAWVEITYLRPFMPGCRQFQKSHFLHDKSSDFDDKGCFQSFVYIGDVESMLYSVHMTSYQPRWPVKFGAHFPSAVEKLLMFVFRVSSTLALLNSLPVYLLDGESILEVALQYSRFLSPRWRRLVLQCILLGGTFVFTLIFFRILFSF